MSNTLSLGTRLQTLYGEVRVFERIGGGTQGDVYKVTYNNEVKAFKWYRTDAFLNRNDFVRNLQKNIDARSPSEEFLWPLDRTQVTQDGHFGYVMDLCPEGFYSADDLFLHPGLFPSYKRIIDACMNIARAFGILHDLGYVYRDISGGNFFINPKTGKVLICDNDNVAAGNRDTGIRGTPRFMAPEVVVTNNNPTEASDRHSLGVIIFYLMLLQHPLEGMRMGMLDGASQSHLYGEDPLFVFDPNDESNRPIPQDSKGNPNNALMIWPSLPQHMKNMFIRAFSQESLRRGATRPDEVEWICELARLRSEVVRCPHCKKHEVFMENARPQRCDNVQCRGVITSDLRAEFPLARYALPVLDDTRVYRCQVSLVPETMHALDPLAWVLAPSNGVGELGVRNISSAPWSVQTAQGHVSVGPEQVLWPQAGMNILLEDETVRIRDNKR